MNEYTLNVFSFELDLALFFQQTMLMFYSGFLITIALEIFLDSFYSEENWFFQKCKQYDFFKKYCIPRYIKESHKTKKRQGLLISQINEKLKVLKLL